MNDCFFGSVTVGERGQVVIPADARAELDIRPGDKLLIMRHPIYSGLMMAKFEEMSGFVDDLKELMLRAQERGEQEEGNR